jgi:alpha-galactosidase
VLLPATILRAAEPSTATPREVLRWTETVFGEPRAEPAAPQGPSLVLRRQDHGQLRVNESVVGTPLRIGTKKFSRGLGTHATSEILVRFPAGAVKSFAAQAGIDNNDNTQGRLGTAEFSVEVGGRPVFQSKTLRGGGEPVAVQVDLPQNADSLVLKVNTADDPSHDHSDWAEARLAMRDGTTVWLDELATRPVDLWPSRKPPFSFTYQGKSSETLLPSWPRTVQSKELPDRVEHQATWSDPATGLKVVATAMAFKDFPAVDWILRFENTGTKDSPILQDVKALDVALTAPPGEPLVLDQIRGDDCSEQSFMPIERKLKPGEEASFAPVGGRPSNGSFPFFNLQCGRGGLFTAIGWTGQWAAAVRRDASGTARLLAGMELTHLSLRPGESIRTPRILLLKWSGERIDGHNQFRRLLTAHYVPRLDGQAIPLAITAQTFNRWAGGTRPRWGTEAGQIEAARIAADLGCDTHWFDAGWFEGNFPNGVGNWFPKPKEFPRGLRPVGDACAGLGLKFLVWYEPERVAQGTQIAREHPEFVLPAKKVPGEGGLFNLGDPKARRWLADLLVGQIAQFNIHTYRNDFNIDPLPFWRGNDPPDRQGITEIRYVEGLYALLDEMRARYPKMYLDNCASGGRRIDLETVMRCVVQTRSDTACGPGRSEWDQCQTWGLSHYLPQHATIGWEVGAYQCRSSAASGFCGEWDILDPTFPRDEARRCVAEMRANRKYWTGDFYPLTAWTMAADQWMAWQLHRPEADDGIVLAFRRQQSPYSELQVSLFGVKPERTYAVEIINDRHERVAGMMTGEELRRLELRIKKQHNSLLVRYAAVAESTKSPPAPPKVQP